MGIVNGPVQGIHIPLISGAPGNEANLLGDNLVTGEVKFNLAEQEFFRLVVHLGNEVDDVLEVHLVFLAVAIPQYFPGLAGKLFEY